MGIVYQTGVECIGKARNYFVFHNTIMGRYGVKRDDDRNESGDIVPPHCGYTLETALHNKDIPAHEIAAFKRKAGIA